MIITIDGPAGSGKSTAAKNLARRLGIAYLDTGAMYRAITLRALRGGVDLASPAELERCAREADLEFTTSPEGLRVWLDKRDVTREIRSEQVTESAHYIASSGNVREVLVQMQRRLARRLGSVVTEGRDQGSVVFPDADVKFYLVADAVERARRRYEEILQAGVPADYEQIYRNILQRDRRDEQRDVAPLVKPDGAVEIDTTDAGPEEVVERMVRHLEQRA